MHNEMAGNQTIRVARLSAWIVAILLGCAVRAPSQTLQSTPLARGLSSPHGVAVHPGTRDVYITESKAGRVSLVKNGRATPVIDSGNWTIDTADIPQWVVSGDRDVDYWLDTTLNHPGALAVSSNGVIYVCEHRPGGRILVFEPDANGAYPKAKVLPIPWLDRMFLWDDIKVAEDGRIFLAGADPTQEHLNFGTILMQDLKGEWWVVDYGPFMNFCGVYLSRSEDVLLVCNKEKGELVWWDTIRHLPIGVAEHSMDDGMAEDAALLPDGSFVVARQADESGEGKLIRLDPTSEERLDLYTGIGKVGSLVMDRASSTLILSDVGKGTVLSLKIPEGAYGAGGGEYLLKRSLEGYQMAEGFTPRKAPSFLKNFFAQMGMETTVAKTDAGSQDVIATASAASFTLREFANRVPLVAGRITAHPDRVKEIENPLVGIDFVIMFPGMSIQAGENAAPSMNYFLARRQDGSIEQTRLLFQGMGLAQRDESGKWSKRSSDASLSIPISTCGFERQENGITVNLAFLGIGIYDDYYLNLSAGVENKGTIIVETKDGRRETYKAVFSEIAKTGQEDANFIVAGFDPLQKSNVGWLNIGRWPVGASMQTEHEAMPLFSGTDEKITEMIDRKNLEWRMESGRQTSDLDEFEATE